MEDLGRLIVKDKMSKYILDAVETMKGKDPQSIVRDRENHTDYYQYITKDGLNFYYRPQDPNDGFDKVGQLLITRNKLREGDIEGKTYPMLVFPINNSKSKGDIGQIDEYMIEDPYIYVGRTKNFALHIPDGMFFGEVIRGLSNYEEVRDDYFSMMEIINGPETVEESRLRSLIGENKLIKKIANEKDEKLKAKNEEIHDLTEENDKQKKQISHLQGMLSRVLNFAKEVKNSTIGKIFFKKKIKELPSGEDLERE